MIAVVHEQPPEIRPLSQGDIVAVAALERAAYEFPWSAGIFRDCLLAGYTSVALVRHGDVLGYAVMSVAAGEAHLLNICLSPLLRRQGIGRYLLEYMMAQAGEAGAEKIFLEVRPSNLRALKVYRKAGFELIGVRRGYYRAARGKEDAVVLMRRLDRESA